NHPFKLSFVADTPPVGIMLVHGCGPLIALTKSGPYKSPGNNFTISQPNSSALAISVNEPQPGDHNTFLLLQTMAISSLNTGVIIKLAPNSMYKDAAAASVTEPTPIIMPGNSLIPYFVNAPKTS